MVPTTTPAETLRISPEALEVANAYLQNPNIKEVADTLDVPTDIVTDILGRREVKAYIDSVFLNIGFNNRFTMRKAMDAIIRKKFQELEESETGSTKDIAELLELSHKMTMQELDRQIKLEEVRNKAPAAIKNQTNIQINDAGGGSNYANLMERLLKTNVQQSG